MILFSDISALHTLSGIAAKDGRRPRDQDLSTVYDAAMLVDGKGRIVFAGPSKMAREQIKGQRGIKRVSLKGCEVLPAFTECHTHLLYSGSRADEFELRNQGVSYLEIGFRGGGIRSTTEATSDASDRELMRGLTERTDELLSQGVTAVEIKSGYAGSIAEELRHLKLLARFRRQSKSVAVVATALSAHSVPHEMTEQRWLEAVEAEVFPYAKREKIRVDIFVEKGAFSHQGGKRYLECARECGLAMTVHADQLSASGGTDLGVLYGAQSVDHVIEVDGETIARLAKSQTTAVLLPAADLYTRLPYPKARQMIDSGVRVALATDHNPGSSPGLDLALVGCLARASMQMTLTEVLAAYTFNAACAVGLQAERGALTPGRRGDFICLRVGSSLHDLFYEIGPKRSMAAIQSVYSGGVRQK